MQLFLLKINILGVTSVFLTLDVKKSKENVKLFLLLSFPSKNIKYQIVAPFTPRAVVSLFMVRAVF